MQGPLREDRASISTKSSDTDLYKMQEPLIKDLTNSTRSYHKDSDISSGSSQHGLKVLYKTLAKIFIYFRPPGLHQETHARSSYKDLQEIRLPYRDLRKAAKIITTPQWEGSDTCKVPRGLRERSHNSHRATTRAIWHAQSHESCAGTC